MTTDLRAGRPAPGSVLAAYRAIHEREEARALTIVHDRAFLDGTRESMELEARAGTDDWLTFEDLEREDDAVHG